MDENIRQTLLQKNSGKISPPKLKRYLKSIGLEPYTGAKSTEKNLEMLHDHFQMQNLKRQREVIAEQNLEYQEALEIDRRKKRKKEKTQIIDITQSIETQSIKIPPKTQKSYGENLKFALDILYGMAPELFPVRRGKPPEAPPPLLISWEMKRRGLPLDTYLSNIWSIIDFESQRLENCVMTDKEIKSEIA